MRSFNKFIWRLLAVAFFSLFQGFAVQAQDGKIPFRERIFFGGNASVIGGSNYTQIELSPMVGYKLTQQWSVGTSPT